MLRYYGTVQDSQGNGVPSATITVYTSGTPNPLPNIYTSTGSRTAPGAQANPFTTDANGNFSFAAANGLYDIVISGGTIPTYTIPNVVMYDGLDAPGTPTAISSVGLSMPASVFTVSGSPITSGSGTLSATLNSQSANFVFCGPNGAAGSPTFRALVAADLPTSGASAATYQAWTAGTGAMTLTAFTVDVYGRITGTSNNSITVPQYGNQGTWTKAQNVAQVTATFGGTTTLDLTSSNSFLINATSNFTLAVTGGVAGGTYCVKIVQSVASSVVTWPASFRWAGGSAGVLSTALNSVDLLTMFYDGTNYLCTLQKAYA